MYSPAVSIVSRLKSLKTNKSDNWRDKVTKRLKFKIVMAVLAGSGLLLCPGAYSEQVPAVNLPGSESSTVISPQGIPFPGSVPSVSQGSSFPGSVPSVSQGSSPFKSVPSVPQGSSLPGTSGQKKTFSPGAIYQQSSTPSTSGVKEQKKAVSPCGEVEFCPLTAGSEAKAEGERDKEKVAGVSSSSEKSGEKSETSEPYYKPFSEKEMSEGKVVEGVYYVVTPEKTTMVQMSNVDVNRILCPVPVQDVVFSEEKGIEVKIVGRNVFVKFKVKKIDESFEYSSMPVDIHVVCADKVYSIIAFPRKIPAALIYLEDKKSELEEKVSELSGLAFEEKITGLVKSFYSGKVPPSAEFIPVNKKHNVYKDLDIEEKGLYVFEGEGLVVKYFTITYTGKEPPQIDLSEKLFLKKELTVAPLAVSLEKLKLKSGESSGLIIIESKRRNES